MSAESKYDAAPEYTVGQMRVQTMRGCEFFYVSAQTTMEDLKKTIGEVMPRLFEAEREGKVTSAGPVVFIYTGDDPASPFLLEMGFPVAGGTKPAGEAKVRRLADFRCASVVYCGALKRLMAGYEGLAKQMEQAGLQGGAEMREWYLYFEGDDSPNNVTMIQHGLGS